MINQQTTPIVITSIFSPNEVIKQFVKKGFKLYIAGDKKTPKNWSFENCEYLSIESQFRYEKLAEITPENHYARKNFAYLAAIESGASEIFETDDDNYPQSNYPSFLEKSTQSVQILKSSDRFFNIYSEFLAGDQVVWPRGYPLKQILNTPKKLSRKTKTINTFIQQSLIDNDTDVDAIYRLTNNRPVTFIKDKKLALDKHVYAPFNSQNTAWFPPAYLFLYLPSTVGSRVCDILRGWIAQRMSWEIDSHLLFLSPCAYQLRNEHDYLKDFKDELPLYIETERTIEILETTSLTGSTQSKFVQIYQALAKANIVQPEEVNKVKAWIKILSTLLK
ncbi:MAG: STELLO glycosyltransferase family protein [Patescibacteria group bacterium]